MKKEIIELLDLIVSKIPSLNTVNFKKTIKTLAYPNDYPKKDLLAALASTPDQLLVVREILKNVRLFKRNHPDYVDEWVNEIRVISEKITKFRVQTSADLNVSLPNIFPAECTLSRHSLSPTNRTSTPLDKQKKRRAKEREDTDGDDEEDERKKHTPPKAAKKANEPVEALEIDSELDDLIHAACQIVEIHENNSTSQYQALIKDSEGKSTGELKLKILITPPEKYDNDVKRNAFGEKCCKYIIWRCHLKESSIPNVVYKPHPLTTHFRKNVDPYKTADRSFPRNSLRGSVLVRGQTANFVKKAIAKIMLARENQQKERETAVSHVADVPPVSSTIMPKDHISGNLSTGAKPAAPTAKDAAILPTILLKPKSPPAKKHADKRIEREETSEETLPPSAKKPAAENPSLSSFSVKHPGPVYSAPIAKKPAAPQSLTESSAPLTPEYGLNPSASISKAPALPPRNITSGTASHSVLSLRPHSMTQEVNEPPGYQSEVPDHISKPAAADSLVALSTLGDNAGVLLLEGNQIRQPPLFPSYVSAEISAAPQPATSFSPDSSAEKSGQAHKGSALKTSTQETPDGLHKSREETAPVITPAKLDQTRQELAGGSANALQTPASKIGKREIITIIDDPEILELLKDDEDLIKEREQAEKRLEEQQQAADAAAKLLAEEKIAQDLAKKALQATARDLQRKLIEKKNEKIAQLQLTTEKDLNDAKAARALAAIYNRKRSSMLFSGDSASTTDAATPTHITTLVPSPAAPSPSTPTPTSQISASTESIAPPSLSIPRKQL